MHPEFSRDSLVGLMLIVAGAGLAAAGSRRRDGRSFWPWAACVLVTAAIAGYFLRDADSRRSLGRWTPGERTGVVVVVAMASIAEMARHRRLGVSDSGRAGWLLVAVGGFRAQIAAQNLAAIAPAFLTSLTGGLFFVRDRVNGRRDAPDARRSNFDRRRLGSVIGAAGLLTVALNLPHEPFDLSPMASDEIIGSVGHSAATILPAAALLWIAGLTLPTASLANPASARDSNRACTTLIGILPTLLAVRTTFAGLEEFAGGRHLTMALLWIGLAIAAIRFAAVLPRSRHASIRGGAIAGILSALLGATAPFGLNWTVCLTMLGLGAGAWDLYCLRFERSKPSAVNVADPLPSAGS